MLSAEAFSLETVNEDEEQGEIDNMDAGVDDTEDKGENQPRFSESAEQSVQASLESSSTQLASDEHIGQSSSAIAPGYVPSELDERIVLELPSSMVRPLKVIRGIFQVSYMGLIHKLFIIFDNDYFSYTCECLSWCWNYPDYIAYVEL